MNAILSAIAAHGCPCGKDHVFSSRVIVEEGAIRRLPTILEQEGFRRVYLLADPNTYRAAGADVTRILKDSGIAVSEYVLPSGTPEPDEANVGLAIMHFDPLVDAVIGVGSGVVNDISKIVAHTTGKPYIIVATAPSMDGYASATSSMTVKGLKISLSSKCADIIVGDLDVLRQAPIKTMLSGLGDMLAKYVSITEWRISHLVTGEYYCESIANLVRTSLKQCTDNAPGLLSRDTEAVRAVFEGLVLSGITMNFAGCSRPASGIEHYFSHVWDMRGVSLGTPVDTHGIQCAVGTYITARLYEELRHVTPDRERALSAWHSFDLPAWHARLSDFLGASAEAIIALEQKERKYDPKKHEKRLESILANWDAILAVIDEELPTVQALDTLYEAVGMPRCAREIGIDPAILPLTFLATKDIREKYILSHFCLDLGVMDDILPKIPLQ